MSKFTDEQAELAAYTKWSADPATRDATPRSTFLDGWCAALKWLTEPLDQSGQYLITLRDAASGDDYEQRATAHELCFSLITLAVNPTGVLTDVGDRYAIERVPGTDEEREATRVQGIVRAYLAGAHMGAQRFHRDDDGHVAIAYDGDVLVLADIRVAQPGLTHKRGHLDEITDERLTQLRMVGAAHRLVAGRTWAGIRFDVIGITLGTHGHITEHIRNAR